MTNTNTTDNRIYVLLKDLPYVNAGAEYSLTENKTYHCSAAKFKGSITGDTLHVDSVENNPEWFKEKQQPIEKRIVINNLWCASKFLNNYGFNTSIPIPEEKYEAVKQAIEKTLNGEMDNPAPQPQDTKEDNPDWEILIIEYCGEQRFLRSDGQYRIFSDGVGFDLQYLLSNGGKIIQVARKSDNEVLSVDDITSEGKITGFATFKNIMSVQFENGLRSCGINVPKKAPKEEQKPILFTTEDGVEIKSSSTIYYEVRDFKHWGRCNGISWYMPVKGGIYFSTKEAAEQYILTNKPLLSISDCCIGLPSGQFDRLTEIAKEKLAKSKTNQ